MIDNQLLADWFLYHLWYFVAKVDENYGADEEVRNHDLGAEREVKVNMNLDDECDERDAKAKSLTSYGFADEPRNQVAAWHIYAAVQNFVVVRVDG